MDHWESSISTTTFSSDAKGQGSGVSVFIGEHSDIKLLLLKPVEYV